jgi:hypothetical protein
MSEDDIDLIKHATESMRDEARVYLMGFVSEKNSFLQEINFAVADAKIRESNAILALLRVHGARGVGPDWQIKDNRVVPV